MQHAFQTSSTCDEEGPAFAAVPIWSTRRTTDGRIDLVVDAVTTRPAYLRVQLVGTAHEHGGEYRGPGHGHSLLPVVRFSQRTKEVFHR